MNAAKQILLVAATTLEAKLLSETLFPDYPIAWNREEKFLYFTVPLSKENIVVIVVTGMGLQRAYYGLKQALSKFLHVDSVIGFGLAGGLIKNSKRGDLVIPKTVQTRDAKWIPLLSMKNFYPDKKNDEPWNKLLSVDELISSPVQKAGVYAASGMEAVDMESGSWAKACVESNINSWSIVRVVLDGGEETLPNMMKMVNDVGEVIPHKAFLHFLFHPNHIANAVSMTPSKLKGVLEPGAHVIQAFLASKTQQEGYYSQRPTVKGKVV